MPSVMSSILRNATRKDDEKLNILYLPLHEGYDSNLAKTGHTFYLLNHPSFKKWNSKFRKLPENFIDLKDNPLPQHVDFDLVLSGNKFGGFQVLSNIANQFGIPVISCEHTLPAPWWDNQQLQECRNMRGKYNLFISEYSINAWGWEDKNDTGIVRHAIDTDNFCPADVQKENVCLSVVNDWINRDWCMLANTKILTTDGYKNIQDIHVDDVVLSDDGSYNNVIRTFSREYSGKIITIKFNNGITASFTENHKIRVYRENINKQWSYIDSQRIKSGDILRFPKHIPTNFSITDDNYAWLIGLIVGDGHITKDGSIQIAFHENETDNINKAKSILESIVSSKTTIKNDKGKCIRLEFTSKIFGNWLRNKIYENEKKIIPDIIMNSLDNVRVAFLRGLWDADGTFKNGNSKSIRFCLSTKYFKLASQVSSILHSIGCKCSINEEKRITNYSNNKEKIIYRVVGYGQDNVNLLKSIFNDANNIKDPYNYIVQSVEISDFNGIVYNCEVENDPSYVVYPGFVSHNCCGFTPWKQIKDKYNLPVKVLGDTPGLSLPASSTEELIRTYQTSRVFLNTSTVSPIPTVLLEAMSCGCAVVSTENCMIPEVITNGVNGFMSNDIDELGNYCKILLEDEELAKKMGEAARQTILEKFNLEQFLNTWNNAFYRVINT